MPASPSKMKGDVYCSNVSWRQNVQVQAIPQRKAKAVKAPGPAANLQAEAAELFSEPPKCPVTHFVNLVEVRATAEDVCVVAHIKAVICVLEADGHDVPSPARLLASLRGTQPPVSHSSGVEVMLMPSGVGVHGMRVSKLNPKAPDEEAAECEGRIAFVDGATKFFTDAPGIFVAELTAELPYTTQTKQSVSLPVPEATQCNFTGIIRATGVEVTIKQAVRLEQIEEEDDSGGRITRVEASAPPVSALHVKWTKAAPQAPKQAQMPTLNEGQEAAAGLPPPLVVKPPAPKKEMLLTSGQDIIHSLGGGICLSTLNQHYTITNGNLSRFTIEIPGNHGSAPHDTGDVLADCTKARRTRVLRVEGAGLHKWEVEDHPDEERTQFIQLYMESAIEGTAHFVVTCETEMVGTSCCVVCPTFRPTGTNRNKGNIAVIARTAVEVAEMHSRHLSKVDVQEMPPKLRANPESVLHAYKFLTPTTLLALEVTKHDDVEVLEATAEEAVYHVTHTGEFVFYHIALLVRNTQRQFARIDLPPHCDVWSCLLEGAAVKPASDAARGSVLIPLMKTTKGPCKAELIFVKEAPLPGEGGERKVLLEMPMIDIPINHLYITLYVPQKLRYGDWVGAGLHDVPRFTSSPQMQTTYQGEAQPVANEWHGATSSLPGSGGPVVATPYPGTGDAVSGIRPLTFNTAPLKTGRVFYLEKLLAPARMKIVLESETEERERKRRRTLKEQLPWECVVL